MSYSSFPLFQIEPTGSSRCHCGAQQSSKSDTWDYRKHTELAATNAFGDIEFDGFFENDRKVRIYEAFEFFSK